MEGYIKLWRSFLSWEWYGDLNTKCLFLHLLLTAGYKDRKYKGKVVKRGAVVTTIPRLSEQTGLTVGEVRTALEHLKATGEIEVKATNRESVITVVTYGLYQSPEGETRPTGSGLPTVEKPADGVPVAAEGQPDDLPLSTVQKKKEKRKEPVKRKRVLQPTAQGDNGEGETRPPAAFAPPTLQEVEDYCHKRGDVVDPKRFYDYFAESDWVDSLGRPVRNWKQKVISWERTGRPQKPAQESSYDIDRWEQQIARQYEEAAKE